MTGFSMTLLRTLIIKNILPQRRQSAQCYNKSVNKTVSSCQESGHEEALKEDLHKTAAFWKT